MRIDTPFPNHGQGLATGARDTSPLDQALAAHSGARGRDSLNASQPAALATWLLKRLGSGPAPEALAGDLASLVVVLGGPVASNLIGLRGVRRQRVDGCSI